MDIEQAARKYAETGRIDRHLKEQIFWGSLQMVNYVVQKIGDYNNNEDLVQEGRRVLWDLIDKYDPNRSTKYSTFIITYVFYNLKKYLRSTKWAVHTPTYISDILVKESSDNIMEQTVEQIAETHKISIAVAENVKTAAMRNSQSSLDVDWLDDIISSNGDFDEEVFLELALSNLPRDQYTVFQLYIDGYQQQEIAEQLECSTAQVEQLLAEAINKLREQLA